MGMHPKWQKNDQDGTRTRNLCQTVRPESNALPLGHPAAFFTIILVFWDQMARRRVDFWHEGKRSKRGMQPHLSRYPRWLALIAVILISLGCISKDNVQSGDNLNVVSGDIATETMLKKIYAVFTKVRVQRSSGATGFRWPQAGSRARIGVHLIGFFQVEHIDAA